MIDLNELAAGLDEPFSMMVRGVAITMRRPDARTSRLIRDACVKPQPARLRKDPTKGSNAPAIPDETDPAYQAAYESWLRRVQAADLCVAMAAAGDVRGLPDLPDWKSPASILAFADAAVDAVARAFTPGEISLLSQALYTVDVKSTEDIALGN